MIMKESDEFNEKIRRERAMYGITPEEFGHEPNKKDLVMSKLISLYVN